VALDVFNFVIVFYIRSIKLVSINLASSNVINKMIVLFLPSIVVVVDGAFISESSLRLAMTSS